MEVERNGGSGDIEHRARLGQNISLDRNTPSVVENPCTPTIRIR